MVSGKSLYGANLEDLDMRGFCFDGEEMCGVDFSGCILTDDDYYLAEVKETFKTYTKQMSYKK